MLRKCHATEREREKHEIEPVIKIAIIAIMFEEDSPDLNWIGARVLGQHLL